MKILLINDKSDTHGGSQIYTLTLKKKLIELGHDVKILSSDKNNQSNNLFADYFFKSIKKNPLTLIFNPFSILKLKKIIKTFQPDIIHLNCFQEETTPCILLLLKNIATIATIHDFSMICPLDKTYKLINIKNSIWKEKYNNSKSKFIFHKFKFKINKLLSKNINFFITVSEYTNKNFKKYFKNNNIICIKNSINLFNFSKMKNNQKILYVGRLAKLKGIQYLIQAMPKIINKFPKTQLIIIGTGPHENTLKKNVSKLKLKKNIKFIGHLNQQKIPKFYKESSIVIIPSIKNEAFGLIGPEAMSIGRPIIASKIGGIPEWLDNEKTGFLIPPKDPNEIAKKTIKLLSNPTLMQQMGEAGRKKAEEEFDINNYIKKIIQLYKQAIKENKSKLKK